MFFYSKCATTTLQGKRICKDAHDYLSRHIFDSPDHSIVCHDPLNQQIIPVFEFHTTSHNDITISRYLIYLKKTLETFSQKSIIPPFIVVDFSWALINSVMLTFNSCTISVYLDWAYRLLVDFKSVNISLVHI